MTRKRAHQRERCFHSMEEFNKAYFPAKTPDMRVSDDPKVFGEQLAIASLKTLRNSVCPAKK